jgi:hypothetical protein
MQENQEKRMIRVSQLKLPVEHSEEQFYQKIEKSLKIKKDQKAADCKKINRCKEETGRFYCLLCRCMG